MNKNKFKASRMSKLRKSNVKGIGFFEGICLKITGRIDGSRDLPREGGDGCWISPHLDREVRSYDEFSSRIWGHLQIEEEDEYARLGELMDSLVYTKRQLETAEADLSAALSLERGVDTSRRHGESKLTETQVIARRADERAKRLASIRNRVGTLQDKLVAEVSEFSALHNKIIEDTNSTRMICARVKDHLLQRMDVYWNSALIRHSENAQMPAVPSIEITSRAEAVYTELHKALMQRAEHLCQSVSKKAKEES